MFLTATNLFAYLNDVGLCSPADVTDDELRIVEMGRRNRNFKVLRTRGPSLFVKQIPMLHPETIGSFIREAACMRLAATPSNVPTLHAVAPTLRMYDETRHVLVYDSLPGGETIAATITREPASLGRLIHRLANLIGAIHNESGRDGALWEIRQTLAGTPPWVLSIGEKAELVMPNMSAAQRKVVDEIRAAPELWQGLAALGAGWSHRCLVHGDLKWDNIMLVDADGVSALRVIDWELADLGEPLWDVAQLTGGILQYWLTNVFPGMIEADMARAIAHAPVRLETLYPIFADLWATYYGITRAMQLPEAESRVLMFKLTGARLVLLAFELMPQGELPTPHAKLALQLARYFFADPVGAGRDLLGINSANTYLPLSMPTPAIAVSGASMEVQV